MYNFAARMIFCGYTCAHGHDLREVLDAHGGIMAYLCDCDSEDQWSVFFPESSQWIQLTGSEWIRMPHTWELTGAAAETADEMGDSLDLELLGAESKRYNTVADDAIHAIDTAIKII